MDFSKIIETIETQKERVNSIQNQADAKTFDDICVILNSTFESIAAIVNVLPIPAKKELIDILKSLRNLAVDLADYKKKFNTTKEETTTVEAPSAPVESTPVQTEEVNAEPVIDETVPEENNSINQTEGQSVQQANQKVLSLNNPNVPKHGNPFVMPNAA